MKLFPIIPIWIMTIISISLIIFAIKRKETKDFLIVILLFLINLRPMIINDSTINQNILFVIDTTISMNTEENNITRIQRAKQDMLYISNTLKDANISIVTFNNSANHILPFTTNKSTIENTINGINTIDILYARGTSLNVPLSTLEKILKRANNKVILFYISDGEVTNNEILNDYSKIKKYISNGAVLGYGTKKGNYIKTENEYLIDPETYEKVISKLDKNNLKHLSKDLDINYIHMTKQSNIDEKLNELKNEMINTTKTEYDDIYYILLPFMIILLISEYKDLRRKIS